MTKGIFLIAFGKRGYAFAAYNIAYSLKYFNKDLKICLFHDDKIMKHLTDQMPISDIDVFDDYVEIPQEILFSDGNLDPCLTKISMYDYLPYDYNLFLDVDGVALKDVTPSLDNMIKSGGNYYTHIFDHWTIQQGNDNQHMVWAWPSEIWDHYGLSKDAKMPSTNSSIQFIKKCEKSKVFFDKLKENYKNKIPLERLRLKWGGGQPDELYLNVTLAQLGWEKMDDVVFFGNSHSPLSLEKIEENYYILSIFGGRGFTRLMYIDWYDRILLKMFRANEKSHNFKVENIIKDKHANQVNSRHSSAPLSIGYDLKKADIPIMETKLISDKLFIKKYIGLRGREVHINNYLNPSVIKFKGKLIMCYRMECLPWCTHTKLALIELDNDYNPVGESKLLDLHSELKGFTKGFHVEDPRLFEHNNELYLSYTDGYQMLQAKIDPVSLTATESFYINKPQEGKTEKNWTFFSDGETDKKIKSVYTISPHVIYEMNGKDFVQQHSTEWAHGWKYGELRGGTSPIKYKDHYLSFFHSSLAISNGRQYFMGAYMFEKEAPYKPIAISETPIIAGEIVPFEIPRLSNKIFVVFPGGVVEEKNSFKVFFGYNDYQCRMVNVTKKYLTTNLKAV